MALQHHTVTRIDTLRSLAKQYYGDENKWAVIFRYNKHYIPNPNQLNPGQVIVIPRITR